MVAREKVEGGIIILGESGSGVVQVGEEGVAEVALWTRAGWVWP